MTEKGRGRAQNSQRPGRVRSGTEEGAGLGAEALAQRCQQVGWITASEHFISKGKVGKAPEMLGCGETEARKFTERSVMSRGGKWKQDRVGSGLGENGKCLAQAESTAQ